MISLKKCCLSNELRRLINIGILHVCNKISKPKINFSDGVYLTYENTCDSDLYFVHANLFDSFKVIKFNHIDFVFLNHLKRNDLSDYDVIISPYLTEDIEYDISLFIKGCISIDECELRCRRNNYYTQIAIITDYVKDALISKIDVREI